MTEDCVCSSLQVANTILNTISALVGFLTPIFILYIKDKINHTTQQTANAQTSQLETQQLLHAKTLKQHIIDSVKSQPIGSDTLSPKNKVRVKDIIVSDSSST